MNKRGISNRKIEIIRYLINNKDTTCKEIGEYLGVSDRTVLNEINDINTINDIKNLIRIERGRGGYLEDNNAVAKLSNYISFSGESENSTITHLIRILLINKFLGKNLFLEEIAEEIYVSLNKLNILIKQANIFLAEYGLNIFSSKTEGTYIVGDEKNIRNCMSEILFNRKSHNYNFFVENNILTSEQIDELKKIIKINLLNSGIEINYISFNNFVMHILISVFRKNFSSMPISKKIDEEYFSHELNITRKIVEEINTILDIDLKNDVFYITEALIACQRLVEYDETKDPIDVNKIVNNILSKVNEVLMLDFRNDDYLKESLKLHLLTSHKRYKSRITDKSVDLTDIKSQYPIAYDIGIVASEVINNELDVKLNDNEILLLSIHFGTSLYKRNSKTYNKNDVLIVCGSGLATAKFLKYSLINQFENDISSIDMISVSDLDEINLNKYDLILSNVDLEIKDRSYLRINSVLSNYDYLELKNKLDKKKNINLEKYIFKDKIFISSFKDKDDWFKFLKFNLVKPGKINEETFNSILKRESLGNTFIGNNVSIPHPLIYKGRNLEIIIFLTSEGLNWDGNNVNLILLLLVPKGETELWDKIFKKLYPIINNSAFIEKISSIKNPDELKKILVREVGKNV